MAEQTGISAEENVLISKSDCAVTFLPQLGAKIASIRIRDTELLQAPLLPYAPRSRSMAFDEADASGWDECLPSVASCSVQTANGLAEVPDHGDLWRVPWKLLSADVSSAGFRGECFSLPLVVERNALLTETGRGWRLALHYTVTNAGSVSCPWSWAAHPLFVAEPGDQITLPASIRELLVEGSGGGRLGNSGDRASWPLAELATGGQADLRMAHGPESAIGDKLFAGPLAAAENWCTLERPKAGLRIRVSFDAAATPYLGLWICYGGWLNRPGLKQQCVAMEPATAPVDSLARVGPWSRTLSAGESSSWPMTVDFETIQV